MNLNQLATTITEIHSQFKKKATSAVNVSLTLRNWFIGYYIVEYEQGGEDRATYGKKLLDKLSLKLKQNKLKNINPGELRRFRIFYKTYTHFSQSFVGKQNEIRGTLPHVLEKFKIRGAVPHNFQEPEINIAPEKLITRLSFTHFTELIKIDNPLKRAFYEIECINGVWSTRGLQRQIASLYYERSGLSENKEKLSQLASKNTETLNAVDIIKNPLTFEFLGLPINAILEEEKLEKALIDNLQAFLLELGNGFCFEARQKRILIDDEYFYIDLVFYHRILKCHVLIEIKNQAFNHENTGQLNVYLQYYKHELMQKGDNPPVGILLCTKSKPTMVKYATASKENIFVNEYKLNLPSEEELQAFVEQKIRTE